MFARYYHNVCSVITAEEIFELKCEKLLLSIIRQNRYLDLGNGSNKFGNHWCMGLTTIRLRSKQNHANPK